ncbi:MAG: sugar O-acetyltransferase [Mogibacterium sp.]|nr:sugar O-acetyltransferase [Mogibacterium sp.]
MNEREIREGLQKYRPLLNSGELYDCSDPEMLAVQGELTAKLEAYNATPMTPENEEKRDKLLREALGSCGEGSMILSPVHANWGLRNVHVGKKVFINYGVMFVDDAEIFIGDYCQIGPGCKIVTAEHPIEPEPRRQGLQYNKPVRLGENVWLGAGAIILPGVTIGKNSVVGAGSVVTRDVEPNVIVVGVPAKVLRRIDGQSMDENQLNP